MTSLESLAGRSFNYQPVGGTRPDGQADRTPAGFHRMSHRALLGTGPQTYQRAGEALMSWRMHAGAVLRFQASTPRAREGADSVTRLGLGRLSIQAPCRVVWTVEEPNRVGFGYGALTGHPEAGEEAFLVTRANDQTVWFTLSAYSRASAWYTRLGGPVARLAQRWFARRYADTLRRLASTAN